MAVQSGNFTYSSTIDSISNLYAEYQYEDASSGMPIAVIMHGWENNTSAIPAELRNRLTTDGLFVVIPGMRAQDGASGNRDASGREIYDIRDAVEYVKTNFAAYVDATQIGVIGYSGGGGNALAFACKFPDYASYIVSHFGMSDYGRSTDGWWYNNDGDGTTGRYTNDIEVYIGGTPAAVPDLYYARDATASIATVYTGGHLYLFHDQDDFPVPIIHSQRVKDAFDAVPLVNYTASFTSSADATRWTHGYDVPGTEDFWAADMAAKTHAAWTVPTSGTVTVIGYMETKRFNIVLGSRTDEAATVTYDTANSSYTVTPLTSTSGSMTVFIEQGENSTTVEISEATTIYLVQGGGVGHINQMYRGDSRLAYINPAIVASPQKIAVITTGIKAKMVSWWTLDETSGTRADSHGANNLTDNNTVGYTTGVQSNAAAFVRANSEYLSVASNPSLLPPASFTLAFWLQLSTLADGQIIGKYGSAGSWGWHVYGLSTGKLRFSVSSNGSSVTSRDSTETLLTATWYFVVAWHDADADTINIQIDNGTAASSVHTTGAYANTTAFTIGGPQYGYTDGYVDEAALWKRVLTADERTSLYNSGSGTTYASL